jgi:hypothetical protein
MAPSGYDALQPMNGALGYMIGGGSATYGSFDEFLGQKSPFSIFGNNSSSGGGE